MNKVFTSQKHASKLASAIICLLAISACGTQHPGDQDIVYVAARNIDQLTPIKISDIVELKRGNHSAGNDLHRLEDFLGKETKFFIPAGETMHDLKIDPTSKSKIDWAKLDRNGFSKLVPVLKTTADVPAGGIVSPDNLAQSLVALNDTPENVMTYIPEGGTSIDGYIALKPLAKGTIVSYEDLSDTSTMSNIRSFVAVRDLPAGTVLTIADLKANMSKEEEQERFNADWDHDDKQKKIAFKDTYDFNNWYEHKLLKKLKKGEKLTESALGPQMNKVGFAAHDLKPGIELKASDILMKFVEDRKPSQDVSELDVAIGAKLIKLIKSGTRINSDDFNQDEPQ